MWSVNTSVARVVIFFTALGALLYIVIVVAGTSSYECPFQTPASRGLRYLKGSKTTQKLLASLSPPNIISLIYAIWWNGQEFLARLSLPSATSLIYTTWMYARQGIVSASRRAYDIVRRPLSWEFSLPRILSSIRHAATKVGHQAIFLLLRIDRSFGNAKYRMAQGIRRSRRARLLPISAQDVHHRPPVPHGGPGLPVRVLNLERIRRQNADNARCVSWVLRNITDPEAIDSAVRLAGTIRWFDGDSDHDPPFDLIISTFEACFDSTKQLYPDMRDRAYFSARAILQINMRARIRSDRDASEYPIPAVPSSSTDLDLRHGSISHEHASKHPIPSSSFQDTGSDLQHAMSMLKRNSSAPRPTLYFRGMHKSSPTHLLWLSNLFVDLIHVDPSPILERHSPYLNVASTDHQATIANILLMWYMFLGGHVEEETLWAVDKSCAPVSLFFQAN